MSRTRITLRESRTIGDGDFDIARATLDGSIANANGYLILASMTDTAGQAVEDVSVWEKVIERN